MPGRERTQTTRRGNQTKVLTTLLWGFQELISFTVSHLQTHNYAVLTLQQLSRVLESFLQTTMPGSPHLHSSTSGSVWNKSKKGLSDRCPAGTEGDWHLSKRGVSGLDAKTESAEPRTFLQLEEKKVRGSRRSKSRRRKGLGWVL